VRVLADSGRTLFMTSARIAANGIIVDCPIVSSSN
jgi:hypothetical protein